MTTTRSNLRRLGRDLCRFAAATSFILMGVTIASDVEALPANSPSSGTPTLNPTSGDSGTEFELIPPVGADCPGTGEAGHRWGTFLIPSAQDPGVLTYTASGSPTGGAPIQSLRNTAGAQIRNFSPAIGNNFINQVSVGFSFTGFSTLPAGEYQIGFSCTLADAAAGVINTTKFWSAPLLITATTGAGPNNFTFGPGTVATTTTTTTIAATTTTTTAATTTTTTIAGGTTTTTVAAGGTTTSTVPGGSTATVSPASPSPGGSYSVSFPNCEVGETITFSQPQSSPASVAGTCRAAASPGEPTATGSFIAAPPTPGSYTVTMTGPVSAQRTVTLVVASAATPVGGSNSGGATGGSPSFGSTGTIPSTGSSTTALIVWGVLLLGFGRMAILLGRKPKVRPVGS